MHSYWISETDKRSSLGKLSYLMHKKEFIAGLLRGDIRAPGFRRCKQNHTENSKAKAQNGG